MAPQLKEVHPAAEAETQSASAAKQSLATEQVCTDYTEATGQGFQIVVET